MVNARITFQPTVYQTASKKDAFRTCKIFPSLAILADRVGKEVGVVPVLIGVDEFHHGISGEFKYSPWIEFVQNDTKVRVQFRCHPVPPHDWMLYMSEVCGFPTLFYEDEGWDMPNLHEYIVEKLRQGPWVISPRLSALYERVRAGVKSLLSRLAKQS